MIRYYNLRLAKDNNGSSPLFVDFNENSALTRDKFINNFRHILCLCGFDDSKYCGHSFRIGAATSAAKAGVKDHMIQTLGRWSSNCYVRYI